MCGGSICRRRKAAAEAHLARPGRRAPVGRSVARQREKVVGIRAVGIGPYAWRVCIDYSDSDLAGAVGNASVTAVVDPVDHCGSRRLTCLATTRVSPLNRMDVLVTAVGTTFHVDLGDVNHVGAPWSLLPLALVVTTGVSAIPLIKTTRLRLPESISSLPPLPRASVRRARSDVGHIRG